MQSSNTLPAANEKRALGSVSDSLQVFTEHRFFFTVSISNIELELQTHGHYTYAIKSFFAVFLPLLMKTVLHLQVDLTDGFNTFLKFKLLKPVHEVLRMCPRTLKVPLGEVGLISRQLFKSYRFFKA